MKITLFILFCCLITFLCCKTKQTVVYELPNAMLSHVKIAYAQQCDKGKILYDLNCAKCHNTTVKRKQIIPDFKEEQLKGYELRVVNTKHAENLPDEQVTEEELGLIMTFLRYKKKNVIKTKK